MAKVPFAAFTLKSFAIAAFAVTNAQFGDFVRETGYTTEAERCNWSFVFEPFVSDSIRCRIARVPSETPWWLPVPHAYWAQPEGPPSTVLHRLDHPVVHVSWNDAKAYCCWSGTCLPSEAQWEFAARGGLAQMTYPWGDELTPDGMHRCNIWQGRFPDEDTGADGFIGTAPVNSYLRNGHGLYNVAGNVWEWCEDYFSAAYHFETGPSDPVFTRETAFRSIRGGFVSLPRVLLQPLPRRRTQRQYARQLVEQHRLQGGQGLTPERS